MRSFAEASDAIGVPAFQYLASPATLGEDVLFMAQRYAKACASELPNVTQVRAQSAIALTLGFPRWQALLHGGHKLLSKRLDDPSVLMGALPLVIDLSHGARPTDRQRRSLEALAEGLASTLAAGKPNVLQVFSAVHGAPSWHEFLARPAGDCDTPLYYLRRLPRGSAVIKQTSTCVELRERLASILSPGKIHCLSWKTRIASAEELVAQRPEFVHGYLSIGSEHAQRGLASCRRFYEEGIKAGVGLLDRGTRSTRVGWAFHANRFFHRLLMEGMRASARHGRDLKRAIELAELQLGLDPADPLGLRFHVPVLQCAAMRDASRSAARLARDFENDDPTALFCASVVDLSSKPRQRKVCGVLRLLRALFLAPALRELITELEIARDEIDSLKYRVVVPDMQAIAFLVGVLKDARSDVYELILCVLNHAGVTEAENRLRPLFKQGLKEGKLNAWRSSVEWEAHALTQRASASLGWC